MADQPAAHFVEFQRSQENDTGADRVPPVLRLARDPAADGVSAAERYVANAIDAGHLEVRGKSLLFVGAGAGAPALVAAVAGARIITAAADDEAGAARLQQTLDANRDAVVAAAVERFGPKPAADDASEEERAAVETRRQRARPALAARPLRWGSAGDARKALEPVGGSGYDGVTLCDGLGAAPPDALLRTIAQCLAKAPSAAALCVFTETSTPADAVAAFVAAAAEYGLTATSRGDADDAAATAAGVRHVELRHTVDEAGPPTDDPAVDVVVVGTGLVESAVSAAAARARLKVLHLDAQSYYGGGLAGGHVAAFEDIVKGFAADFISATPRKLALEKKIAALSEEQGNVDAAVEGDAKKEEGAESTTDPSKDRRAELQADLDRTARSIASRQVSVDVLPVVHLADGPLVRTFAASQIGPQLSFHNVCRVATIDATVFPRPAVATVPLSRAAAFKSKALGPMDVRRLMAFVKDLTASMPEPTHEEPDKPDPEEETPDEATERIAAGMCAGAGGYDAAPLADLLSKKYKLSASLQRLLTLDGELCDPQSTSGLSGIRLLHRYVTSVGRYGGATPFLTSLYGAAELPQQLCRMAAVWDATFVLSRSVARVEAPESGSGVAAADGADADPEAPFVRPPTGRAVVLSNGQRVAAKVVVAPSGALAPTPQEAVSRAVVMRRGAAITWELLEKEPPAEDDGAEVTLRDEFREPLVVASVAFKVPREGAAAVVRATVVQQSSATDQAPAGCTLLHATAPAADVSPAELLNALSAGFGAVEGDDEITNVLYSACFTLDPARVDAAATGGRRVEAGAAQTWGREGPAFAAPDTGVGRAAATSVVPVRTLFPRGLDDTRYVAEAQQAFVAVLKACGLPEDTSFLLKEESEEAADDAY